MKHRRFLLLLSVLVLAAVTQCGCFESNQARSEHRTTTETWQGSTTLPLPAPTADGRWTVAPTPVPFSLTKTTEENSDGTMHTQTGIDPQAMAALGTALAGSLKTAFPVIGAVSDAASGGMDMLKALLGGTTVIGGGLAALAHRTASRTRTESDQAWDEASEAKARAAAAEARLEAMNAKTA